MRPEQDGVGTRVRPGAATEHVSHLVDTGLQARVLHRVQKPVPDLLVRIRQRQSVEATVVGATDIGLCLHRLDKSTAVYLNTHTVGFPVGVKGFPNQAVLRALYVCVFLFFSSFPPILANLFEYVYVGSVHSDCRQRVPRLAHQIRGGSYGR